MRVDKNNKPLGKDDSLYRVIRTIGVHGDDAFYDYGSPRIYANRQSAIKAAKRYVSNYDMSPYDEVFIQQYGDSIDENKTKTIWRKGKE